MLKQVMDDSQGLDSLPAAFGRLCVETMLPGKSEWGIVPAAFGRLCVETNWKAITNINVGNPAAFGRLCVETKLLNDSGAMSGIPAAFGRLCVETISSLCLSSFSHPAAFGRLCVETQFLANAVPKKRTSRLRAAVC